MKHNDEDIKIFHPSKNGSAGADLAELALMMDIYRTNGNMEKATSLGQKLADISPEKHLPQRCGKAQYKRSAYAQGTYGVLCSDFAS